MLSQALLQVSLPQVLVLTCLWPVLTRYPDATPEELQAMDNVCIICREEMVTGAKRLPCNHIFHTRWEEPWGACTPRDRRWEAGP